MKKLLFILLVVVQATIATAQVPVYRWAGKIAGTSSEYSEQIAFDNTGNVYICGRFEATCDFDPSTGSTNLISGGSSDMFVAKYSTSGALIWAIKAGSTGTDRANYLTVDGSGNVYVTGYFAATVDFDPGAGVADLTAVTGSDMFFAKYNSDGNYVWAKAIGGPNTEYGEVIAFDGVDGIYIAGEYSGDSLDLDAGTGVYSVYNTGTSIFTYDPFLAKYDTAGNFNWGLSMTGNSTNYPKSLAFDASQNVIVGGYFSGSILVDLVSGSSLTSNGSSDGFIARFSSTGTYLSSYNVGGPLADYLYSICENGGNIYATGTYNGIVDFDPGVDTVYYQSKGLADVFVVKFDATGALTWAKSLGGVGADISNSIKLNTNGDVYVTGSFVDSAEFNTGTASTKLTAYGGRDAFIVKYDASGNLKFAQKLGSALTDYGRGLGIDQNGDIWNTGYYGAATFYPNQLNLATTLTYSGVNDVYLVKYGECEFPQVTAQPINSGVCPGGATGFSLTATAAGITYQWQEGTNGGITWNDIVNGGAYSGATTPSLTLTGLTTAFNNRFYRCVISASCGLSLTSGVGILFVGSPDTTVNVNGSVLVSAQSNASYQWLDCNNGNSAINGATQQQFIPTTPGSYAVAVTRNGCTDTSSCYTITTIGINDLTAKDVRIYPVPASESVNIEMVSIAEYEAAIYDLTGRNILSDKMKFSSKATLQTDHLDSGIYLIGIRKDGGNESFFRIIIQ